MFEIITITLIVLLSIALFICIGVIRGFLRVEKSNLPIKPLTGWEIEALRRRLASVGMQAITANEVFCLIKTIRDMSLGLWTDPAPYFPADPYEDIDEGKKR